MTQISALMEEVWGSAWIAILMFLGYVRSFRPGDFFLNFSKLKACEACQSALGDRGGLWRTSLHGDPCR